MTIVFLVLVVDVVVVLQEEEQEENCGTKSCFVVVASRDKKLARQNNDTASTAVATAPARKKLFSAVGISSTGAADGSIGRGAGCCTTGALRLLLQCC